MSIRRDIAFNTKGQKLEVFPFPIVEFRNPTIYDVAEVGQTWINKTAQTSWTCCDDSNGVFVWTATPAGGIAANTMTINPGDVTITAGDLLMPLGDITAAAGTLTIGGIITTNAALGGTLNVAGLSTLAAVNIVGNVTVTGDFDLTNAGSSLIESTNNAAGAIELLTNGGANETLMLVSAQGTGADAVQLTSTLGGMRIYAGRAAATAVDIQATNAAGGISMSAGTGGLTVATTNGNIAITSGTGTVAVTSTNAAIAVNSGTGIITLSGDATVNTINIGTGAAAKTITMGSTAGTTVNVCNGANTVAQNINIANGACAAITNVNIANGNATAGVQTVNIAGGTSVAGKVVNIASGAAVNTVTIGSATGASATTLRAGTAGLTIDTGGLTYVDCAVDTQASPSATSTLDVGIGRVLFTGFTTAAAASQTFTITNANIDVTSCVFVTAMNTGVNDAQMTVTRVKPAAGSMEVTLTNYGAAALNGNVSISFWILN